MLYNKLLSVTVYELHVVCYDALHQKHYYSVRLLAFAMTSKTSETDPVERFMLMLVHS